MLDGRVSVGSALHPNTSNGPNHPVTIPSTQSCHTITASFKNSIKSNSRHSYLLFVSILMHLAFLHEQYINVVNYLQKVTFKDLLSHLRLIIVNVYTVKLWFKNASKKINSLQKKK